MTTQDEVTDAQIKQLQAEAGAHGDPEMHAICERALDGDAEAREECERVIREARANAAQD